MNDLQAVVVAVTVWDVADLALTTSGMFVRTRHAISLNLIFGGGARV